MVERCMFTDNFVLIEQSLLISLCVFINIHHFIVYEIKFYVTLSTCRRFNKEEAETLTMVFDQLTIPEPEFSLYVLKFSSLFFVQNVRKLFAHFTNFRRTQFPLTER